MTSKSQIHYRRSIRLKDYDYSQAGAYFVTICTHNRAMLFDNNSIRAIAEQCWQEIPDHFLTVRLDEWIVMPNHIHGILVITDKSRDTACRVPTFENFGKPTSASLPTIIRSYKSAVEPVAQRGAGCFLVW